MYKKNNPVRVVIVLAVFIAIVVASYFFLSNRPDENVSTENDAGTLTVVQEVLARNLKTNYPPTPKEVVKYYSEITRCFYGEKYTDEELVKLAAKSRELFDTELYNNQSDDEYLQALKREIEAYKEENKAISSYSVSSSIDVEEYKYEGREWAQLYCMYSVRVGTKITPVQEKFLLRRDEEGHWKILGWELQEDQ